MKYAVFKEKIYPLPPGKVFAAKALLDMLGHPYTLHETDGGYILRHPTIGEIGGTLAGVADKVLAAYASNLAGSVQDAFAMAARHALDLRDKVLPSGCVSLKAERRPDCVAVLAYVPLNYIDRKGVHADDRMQPADLALMLAARYGHLFE